MEPHAPAANAWPVHCTAHPERSAAAFCTVCKLSFAGLFLAVRPDGRAICHTCAREQGGMLYADATRTNHDPLASRGMISVLGALLLRPSDALVSRFSGAVAPALGMSFVASLIGYASWVFWILLLVREQILALAQQRLGTPIEEDLLVTGLWISVPILAFIRTAVAPILVHIGARLAGAPEDSLRANVRATALSSVSLLLVAIPALGAFLALIVGVRAMLHFLRAKYEFSYPRAVLALLPFILLYLLIGPLG
jgi:uncharacterized membrane protein